MTADGIQDRRTLADRRLIEQQIAFYDLRAPDFGDEAPTDRMGDAQDSAMLRLARIEAAMERLQPAGDVLELAPGPGAFTASLARRAASLTVVDASPQMLARNRDTVGDPSVTYIEADLFSWRPPATYDVVFFGHWLSHVPPSHFDAFWELVRTCLRPAGRVGFVDERDAARGLDLTGDADGTPVATRTLTDGRRFDIVKVFWAVDELEQRLRSIGWDIAVEPLDDRGLIGIGRPRQDSNLRRTV